MTEVEKRKAIVENQKKGFITEIQAQALLSKLKGNTLTTNERAYIYNLKQIIQRAEKNWERVEAIKQLLILLDINPQIGEAKQAKRVCSECGGKMVNGVQNYYCKGKKEEYLAFFEDIPSINCLECDHYLTDFDTTIVILDELLEAMDKKVQLIQQIELEESEKKLRCPICDYKYLGKGRVEIHLYKRCDFNLLVKAVPVAKYCQQCEYYGVDERVKKELDELVEMVTQKLVALRNSGWKTKKK